MSIQEQLLTEIADAIRTKGGTSATIAAKDFAKAILAIPTTTVDPDPDPGPSPVTGNNRYTIAHNMNVLAYDTINSTLCLPCNNLTLQNIISLKIVGICNVVIDNIQIGECILKGVNAI